MSCDALVDRTPSLEKKRLIAARDVEGPEGLERLFSKVMDLKGYTLTNGIALIGHKGALSDGDGFYMPAGHYDQMRAIIEKALEDDAVKSIVIFLDSPGGDCSGLFELCDFIMDHRGEKPFYAYGQGLLCSAAYAIASATGDITVSDTTEVGSIGAYAVAWKGAEDLDPKKEWVKVMRSSNAENKNLSAWSEEGEEDIQAKLDHFEARFHGIVADFMGISPDGVADATGHGRAFIGNELLERGMVSRISKWDEFIALVNKGDAGIVNEELETYADGLVLDEIANISQPEEREGEGEKAMDENTINVRALSAEDKEALFKALIEDSPSLFKEMAERAKSEALEAERVRTSELNAVRDAINASIIDKALADGRALGELWKELADAYKSEATRLTAELEGVKAELQKAKAEASASKITTFDAITESATREADAYFSSVASSLQDVSVPAGEENPVSARSAEIREHMTALSGV